MPNLRSLSFLLAVIAALVSSCGSGQPASPATSVPGTTTTVPGTAGSVEVTPSDPTFWPVGPEFTSSVAIIDGAAEPMEITIMSLLTGQIDINLDNTCGYGGSLEHRIVRGTLEPIQAGFALDGIGCEPIPADQAARAEAVTNMLLASPSISRTPTEIRIWNDDVSVTLTTLDPTANVPVVDSGVHYFAVSSTIAGVEDDVDHIKFLTRAIFVGEMQLESCRVHMQIGGLNTIDPRDEITGVNVAECPKPTASDAAVLSFLEQKPKLALDGVVLTIATPDETLTLTSERP